MRQIILKVLSEVACKDADYCQINLQSESAQIMIADKLMDELNPHVQHLIEEIICPSNVPTKE